VSIKDPSSFQVRASVSAIPGSVRASFAKARGEESFVMAEPGGEWQVTDVIGKPELPRRRLKAVALSREFCILFYELGGRGHSHHVVVFRLSHDGAKLVWRALCEPAVTTPAAVFTAVDGDTIDDDPKNGF
jgi:hypothetical protein